MTTLTQYQDKYAHFARMERDDQGILTVTLHTNGGEWIMHGVSNRDLIPDLFTDLGLDPQNRVVIFTGTGAVFCNAADPDDLKEEVGRFGSDVIEAWRMGGNRGSTRHVELEAITIWALNGPVSIHAELWACADLFLAAEGATVQDGIHLATGAAVGGDAQVVWETLLGTARAKYFLLTAQTLTAEQLHDLGVVHEIVPRDQLLPRAVELARQLVKTTPPVLRFSKLTLNQRFRRQLVLEQPYGQALVMLGFESMLNPGGPKAPPVPAV